MTPNLLTTIRSIKWIEKDQITIFEYHVSDCVTTDYSELDCKHIFELIGFSFSIENKNRILFFSKLDKQKKRYIFDKFIRSLLKFHKNYND
jgi:hypothetical protein